MHLLQKKISLFKQRGYKVYLHNIDIPGDESYRRAFVRYLETGRLINHAYLLDVADKPNLVYKQVKESNLANGYKKIDNFVKEGQQPILIENQGGISLGEKSSKSARAKIQGTREPELSTEQKIINEFKEAEFSIGTKLENDEIVPEIVTARQVLNDIENDQAIITRLKDCVV